MKPLPLNNPLNHLRAPAALLASALLAWSAATPAPAQVTPEFRALWADAFNVGFRTPAQTSALVADARRGNFNAIVVQVRKRGDAFYDSAHEPKATQVSPQSYDPLADLIAKAKAGPQPLEVHAWIVTYNIWNRQSSSPEQPDHPFNLHPDWLTRHHSSGTTWDGANHAFDPGHPEVQQHTFDVCMDLIENYDIDGLHLDYIRYSEAGSSAHHNPWGYNPVAVERFNRLHERSGTPHPGDSDWLQFRRDQVTGLVRKLYLHNWALRPQSRLSAATITFSHPPAGNSADDFKSTDAYSRVLQDWRGWLEEGILDLNMAMNYRDHGTRSTNYGIWCDRVQDLQFARAGAVGFGSFLNTTPHTIEQIRIARTPSPSGKLAAGVVGFSYAAPNDDGVPRSEFLDALTKPSGHDPNPVPVFASQVPTPDMPWKSDQSRGHAMGTLLAADGSPADGAVVSICGEETRTILADATGFFGAVDLPAGDYEVTATFPDHAPLSASLTVAGALVTKLDAGLTTRPFEILALEFDDRLGGWQIAWRSEPGQSFSVQVSENLGQWTDLAVGVEADAEGDVTTYRDFTAGGQRRGFYRIRRDA